MISTTYKRRTSARTAYIPRQSNGDILTIADLPPSNMPVRWTGARKAAVVEAIAAGLLTVEGALARYRLSDEELASWRTMLGKQEELA